MFLQAAFVRRICVTATLSKRDTAKCPLIDSEVVFGNYVANSNPLEICYPHTAKIITIMTHGA